MACSFSVRVFASSYAPMLKPYVPQPPIVPPRPEKVTFLGDPNVLIEHCLSSQTAVILALPHIELALLPQLSVAALLVVSSAALLLPHWKRDWGPIDVSPDPGYPNDPDWRAAVRTLPAESTPAEAFSGRAKEMHSAYEDALKALDDKAAAILGLVGGGSGIVALAAGSEKIARPTVTPLLILAAVFLFCVLASLIAVQIPRRRATADVERLTSVRLLKADAGKSEIDAIMGREYIEASRSAYVVLRKKASHLWAAQLLFAFGVCTIVLNALIPSGLSKEQAVTSTVLHCTIVQPAIDCKLMPTTEPIPPKGRQ